MTYNQLTTEQFIEKARKVHGDKYDYSKVNYLNNREKVIIICPKHGGFKQTPGSHLSGRGCKECQKETLSTLKTSSKEQFIEKARKVHGDKYDYSKVEYVKSSKPVCIICPKHGEFQQTPNNHLRGQGCQKCYDEHRGITQRSTKEEFIKKAKEIHGNKYDYSKVEYVNSSTNVRIICPEHGEFWQRPDHHLSSKCGCPKCKAKHFQCEIRLFLKKNNIFFEEEKTFDWLINDKTGYPQYLDFYIPAFKVGIECHGKQHFEPVDIFGGEPEFIKTQKRDENKLKKCNENGLKLVYFGDKKYKKEMTGKLYFSRKAELLKEIREGLKS